MDLAFSDAGLLFFFYERIRFNFRQWSIFLISDWAKMWMNTTLYVIFWYRVALNRTTLISTPPLFISPRNTRAFTVILINQKFICFYRLKIELNYFRWEVAWARLSVHNSFGSTFICIQKWVAFEDWYLNLVSNNLRASFSPELRDNSTLKREEGSLYIEFSSRIDSVIHFLWRIEPHFVLCANISNVLC